MAVQKNIPDRTKLILQFIVFSLAAWLPLLFIILFLCMFLNIKVEGPNMVLLIWGSLAVSLFIQGAIFIHRWRKLLQRESLADLPDMQDMRNITPRQLILFIIGFPFLVTSYVLFQFDNKRTAILCFIAYLVLWGIETVYVRKRAKKIIVDKNIK